MKRDEPILSFSDEQRLLERKNQFFLDLAKQGKGIAPGRVDAPPSATNRTAGRKARKAQA